MKSLKLPHCVYLTLGTKQQCADVSFRECISEMRAQLSNCQIWQFVEVNLFWLTDLRCLPPQRLYVPRFLCAHGNKSTMMKDAKSKMHVKSKPRLQGFVKKKKLCNQNISVTFSMVLKSFWFSLAVTLQLYFPRPFDSKWDVTCLILRPKWAVLIESYLRNILESVPKLYQKQ